MVVAGASERGAGTDTPVMLASGRSRVEMRLGVVSVGVGETAVVVGAGAVWCVGAVRAGAVGLKGEKW